MDWFLPPSCGTRRLSDIYSPIFWPATFLSLCKPLWRHESAAVNPGRIRKANGLSTMPEHLAL